MSLAWGRRRAAGQLAKLRRGPGLNLWSTDELGRHGLTRPFFLLSRYLTNQLYQSGNFGCTLQPRSWIGPRSTLVVQLVLVLDTLEGLQWDGQTILAYHDLVT